MSYTNSMNGIAAIIPVAGLSLRMGSFKPLLLLNGFPMIQLTVQSAFDGNVSNVCVVTGRNAQEVEDTLNKAGLTKASKSVVKGLGAPPVPLRQAITFAHNKYYASTDMLQSIKLGLSALLHQNVSDGLKQAIKIDTSPDKNRPQSNKTSTSSSSSPQVVFIIPGDMPAVSPHTFTALHKRFLSTQASVLVPTHRGKPGHPLLVSSSCFDAVLSFEEDGGLRQALAKHVWHEVPVNDPGILLDADTPAAFSVLEQRVRKTRGVSSTIIEGLFERYGTPGNVQEHTAAVGEVAKRLAQGLNAYNFGLDVELCSAGGQLHDLNRVEPNHSQVAAKHLQKLGYTALSKVVAAHDRELRLRPRMFTEANLVFLADKLVKDDTLVEIAWRYRGALKRYPPNTELGALIERDSKSAQRILDHYVKLTGDTALLQGTQYIRKQEYEDV